MDRREISLDNETTMLAYLGRLNERDRRLYAAVEAHKLGYGGVYKGIAELKALAKSSDNDVDDDPTLPLRKRIRRPGAGRPAAKQRDSKLNKLNQAFLDVVALHTAGDPMKEEKQWTDLSVKEISGRLRQKGDREVGEHVVKRLLKDNGFRRLALRKELMTGHVDATDRNTQFENIAALREKYISNGKPVIAVDTKDL